MLFGYKGFDGAGIIHEGYIKADNKKEALSSLRVDKEIIALIYIKKKYDAPAINKMREYTLDKKNKAFERMLSSQQNRKAARIKKREKIKSGDVETKSLKAFFDSIKDKLWNKKNQMTNRSSRGPSGKQSSNVFYIERTEGDSIQDSIDAGRSNPFMFEEYTKPKKVYIEEGKTVDWNALMPEDQTMEIRKNSKIRIKEKEILLFTKQLRMMLKSGVSLMKSLILLRDSSSKKLSKVLDSVIESIEKGSPLSLALSKFPRQFDSIYISLVNIGETSGSLNKALSDVIYYKEKNMKVKKKLKSASIYPSIIGIVLSALLVLGSVYFIPMFEEMFASQGVELPWLTKLVFVLANNVPIIIGALVVVILLVSFLRKTSKAFNLAYKSIADYMLFKIPFVKGAINASYMFSFSSSTALMLENGIRLKDALQLTEKVLRNIYIKHEIVSATDLMIKGFSFSESISNQKHFDELLVSVIATGEESGKMSESLREISEYYDEELNKQITTLMEVIQPVFILLIAGIVVPVVIAIYLPIIELSSGAVLGL